MLPGCSHETLSLTVTSARSWPPGPRPASSLTGQLRQPPHWPPCFLSRPYLSNHRGILNKNRKISLVLKTLHGFSSRSKAHLHVLAPGPICFGSQAFGTLGTSACQQGPGQTRFFSTSGPLSLLLHFSQFLSWVFLPLLQFKSHPFPKASPDPNDL